MGEVVGAGLLAHVPTIVLPEETRLELNEGKEITLVTGLRAAPQGGLRRPLDYDTVVVLDSHWATTVEFVVTAQQRRAGLFTSEELPRGMCRMPYDFPGDPELAHAIVAKVADKHGTWITAIDDDYLPIFYATTNLWKFLGEGLPDKRWISIGVCQTGDTEDNLRLGRALGDGDRRSPTARSCCIASGALSHTFWPLRELRDHEAGDPAHIFTPEAREADLERIAWFKDGDHDQVLDTMPEFCEVQARGEVRPLPDDDRRARRAATAPPRPASTASTRTRSAPARCTCGSTVPRTGWTGPAPPDAATSARRTPHRRG